MSVYAVDKLMAPMRKRPADFRQMTGQPLPLTAEIANFDDEEIWESTPGS